MRRALFTVLAGLALAFAGASAVSAAVSVETQTITVPNGGDNGGTSVPGTDTPSPDDSPATPPPDDNGLGTDANAPIPEVSYDLATLPKPVARLREQIIAAAATGDPEQLRAIIEANGEPPLLGPNNIGDPIGYLKLESGDSGGREILAILSEVLEAGFVHVDVGTPDEIYLWPYFARYPIDKLSPQQMVQLFKLVYAGDYEDMLAAGQYTYFRVGISPAGVWKYFVSDE